MALQDDINNFGTSNTASDLVLLAAQTNLCTPNRSIRVPTTSCLPDLACGTVAPGTIIFVDDLCVPVVAQIGCWTGLDNRVLRNDISFGLLYGWGGGGAGRLGDGTTTTRSSPVSVVGEFTDWCQVSAGATAASTSSVRTNGTLWAWGCNNYGMLGDGTATNRSSPVSVVGGFTDWCQVSIGNQHTAAVRTNGTLWAWGRNFSGQLGHNTTFSCLRSSPVSVVGGFTDWCQVSVNGAHTAAVRANGTLWAWGNNSPGQLGDGTTTNRSSPVSVVGGFTDWCQVAAGGYSQTAAVRTNGTLWAWGSNVRGQLGDNTTINKSSPVSVVGGFTDWCQVSAGSQTAAVRTNGTLWAWGCNSNGQLGDGTATNRSSPVAVAGGFTDWCQVAAGFFHTAAVRTNGTAWAWGLNSFGRLGDNTTISKRSPVSVAGGFTDWCQVAAGNTHTAAIRNL